MSNPFDLMGMLEGSKDAMATPFDLSTQVASADTGEQGTLRGLIERLLPQRSQQTPTQSNLAVPQAQPQNQLAPDASRTPMEMDRSSVGHPAADTLAPVQKAFLNAIASGESGGKYNIRYSPNGAVRFTDMSKHPGIMEAGPAGPSSAAGRYQITKSTWNSLGGGPFDPTTQDIRAWQLADRDYYSKTGRDLKTDLEKDGLTPKIARDLGGTWVALKSGYRKMKGIFDNSVQMYGSQSVDKGNAIGNYGEQPSTTPLDANANPVRAILDKHQTMLDDIIANKPIKMAGQMDSISRYGRPNVRGDQPTKEKLKSYERRMEKQQIEDDMKYDENAPRFDQQSVQKIGEVIPLPIAPGPNTGPTNRSADYGYGLKGEPGVVSIGVPTMSDWLRRTVDRLKMK